MNKLILAVVVGLSMGSAVAQTLTNEMPKDNADGSYKAPQYLPGYPTAAPIFPRVQPIECDQKDGKFVNCDTPNWMPNMGRGEYLTFTPVPRAAPTVILKETHKETLKETIREVPAKPGRE